MAKQNINQVIPAGKVGVLRRGGDRLAQWQAGVTAIVTIETTTDAFTIEDPPPMPAPMTQTESDRLNALQNLALLDSYQFKLLDYLVQVLITKGTIAATDFPAKARQLYQQRKAYLDALTPGDVLP